MLSAGITMEGEFIGERLETLPIWQPSDEGRQVYSLTTQKYYFGTSTAWKDMSGAGDLFLDADTVDGFHASYDPRPNTLLALDANAQLPASVLMLDNHYASISPSANCIPVYDINGKIPSSITGDANTLGTIPSSGYVRTNATSTISGFYLIANGSSGQMNVSSGSQPSIEIRAMNPEAEPALMKFSRPGSYSVFFGLDVDGNFKFGGISEGSNVYKFWTEKNDGIGSGLDADKVDGYQTTFTSSPSSIPVLDANGKLDEDMIPSSGVPVGSLIQFPLSLTTTGGTGIYSDYISCRGQTLSVSAYPSLASVLGNLYGGDGINTIVLPDYRGQFLRMIDANSGNDPDSATRTAATNGSTTGVGSTQDSANLTHIHWTSYKTLNSYAAGSTSAVNDIYGYGSGISGVINVTTSMDSLANWSEFPDHLITESRPKNVYIEIGIKWR